MGKAELAGAARLLRTARSPEVFAYAARQAWQRARGRYVESLRSYRVADAALATLDTPDGRVYVPRSLERAALAALLRDTYDPRAWHRYDGPWAPLRPGAVVVDCGVSAGLWAQHVAATASQLVLVEPQEAYCHALELTFASGLAASTVELHRCALGATDGTTGLAGEGLTAHVEPGAGTPLRRLDTLLGGRRVDFVKADVEGAELALVEGALETIRRHRPTLALTVYHPENDWREIRDLVRGTDPGYEARTRGATADGKPILLLLEPRSLVRGI